MPTPIDIQAAVINQAADNAEQIGQAAQTAEEVDVRALIRSGASAQEIIDAILIAGVVASAENAVSQLRMVVEHVTQSAEALRKADPATVPAVKNEDIAAKRAEKAGV